MREADAMKALLPALCVATIAAGPAAAADRNFSITSFDQVRVQGPYKVKLTTGVAPFAVATGSDAALDRVSVEVEGRTLVVGANQSAWGGFADESVGPVEISVGTHDLSAAWVNGAGTLAIDGVRGLEFDLSLQGSGSAAIGTADVDVLKVGLSGAGSASIAGRATRLTAIVRGTSSLDASALASKDAVVGAEGPSTISFVATNTAKIDVRGTSSVNVGGNPACTVKADGSAVVTGCR
jgi:hypothetical protein